MATLIYLGNPPPKIKEWIEKNYKPEVDMTKVPLHFVAEESNATMRFNIGDGTYETSLTGEEGSWTSYESNTPITLANVGDKVYFRAGSDEGNETCSGGSQFYIGNGDFKGKIAAKGNIQSLLDRKMERMDVPYGCYASMFKGCTTLTQAPALPADKLSPGCYANMFQNCTSLTEAPLLPATNFQNSFSCYEYMFVGCSSLPEPKYDMSHMTFDQVASAIQNSYILGERVDSSELFYVKCSSNKVLMAQCQYITEADLYIWTITEG